MQTVGFPYSYSLREHLRRGLLREPPRYAFLGRGQENPAAWREGLLGAVRELAHAGPDPAPAPEVRLLGQEDTGEHVVARLAIQVAEDLSVPCYLLSPRDPDLPAPAVLYLSQYHAGKAQVAGELEASPSPDRGAAVALCHAGVRVLIPDLPDAGERQDDLDSLAATLLACGDSLCGWVARECLALLAYLRSLPETPPGQVGLLGTGDTIWPALLAAALDPAVKAVALEGDLTRPAEKLLESNCLQDEFYQEQTRWWPPGILPLAETADLATLLAPRPLLLVHYLPPGNETSRTLRLTEQGYAALGHKPRLETHNGWTRELRSGSVPVEFFGVWLPAALTD
jgi:hypothetical protein